MVLSFVDALDEAFSELLSTKSSKKSTVSFPTELLENKSRGARIMAESPFLLTCSCRAVVVTEAVLIYPLPSMRCRGGHEFAEDKLDKHPFAEDKLKDADTAVGFVPLTVG